MSDREDQAQIADTLTERYRRKQEQLDTETRVAPIDAMLTSFATALCGCGRGFTQTTITGAGKAPITGPDKCEVCRGVAQDAKAQRAGDNVADAKAAAHEKAVKAALDLLDAPRKYAGVSLETFRMHGTEDDKRTQLRFLNFARRFLADFPDVRDFNVFMGEPGTGKGHVAWSICLAVAGQGYRVRNVKLGDLVRSLRDTWGAGREASEAKVLAGYRELDLLVIDEVSRHAFYGQNIHQHLYDVIDYRIDSCLPTILTTNEDDAGLSAIIRPAMFNRLQGEGGVIEFGTASWRSREAA